MSATTRAPVRLRATPEPLSGGFWAQIWKVDLDNAPAPFDRPLVLRVMPDRQAGHREAIVQRVVAHAGFPSPQVLTSSSAPGLGEAYIVMERVNGLGRRLTETLLAQARQLALDQVVLTTLPTMVHAEALY